jgi:5-hydroxyisourate hydrolase-like protein (transthyretin family)
MKRLAILALLAGILDAQAPRRPFPGGGLRSNRPGTEQSRPTPQPETNPEDYGSVSGKVFDALTGQPLSKVQLQLVPEAVRAPRREAYTASTNSSGVFHLIHVEPGNYRLSAERNRYVRQQYGQKSPRGMGATITLGPKQHIANIEMRLMPGAVVTGRVTDEDGEPLAGVRVSVMQYRYVRGRRELAPVAGGSSTNDLGEYRIWDIPPGRYYVSASYQPGNAMRRGAAAADEAGYPTIIYPGVLDAAQTTPIAIRAAEVKSGIDFRMARIPTVRISGVLRPVTGTLPPRLMMILMPRGGATPFNRRIIGVRPDTGRFEVGGITAGRYLLQAFGGNENESLYASVALEVGGANIENLELTLAPGANLSGQIRVEAGGSEPLRMDRLRVFIRPIGDAPSLPGPGNFLGTLNADGSFVAKNIRPGPSMLQVNGLPEGYYVKSVKLGGQEVVETGFELLPGVDASGLTVTLSPDAARVDGGVTDDRGAPSTGATVVIVPVSKYRREAMLSFPTASTDQHGRFSLPNLAPGDYLLFAWDDVEPGAWQDPNFLELFEEQATKVKLQPKDIQNVDLKLLGAVEG